MAHLDCTVGVAGDMLLGAFLDAGADQDTVTRAVRGLRVPGLALEVQHARRGGFRCTRVTVTRPQAPDKIRRLPDIQELIAGADGLSPRGVQAACRAFLLLAEAEAQAHGTTPEQVHFHEVGAYDALADVVGCVAAADSLGLLSDDALITCSALAAGSGQVTCEHGLMPVPVPAVLHLAHRAGLELTSGELAGERTTPTGAALVAALAVPRAMPTMTVRAVGSGGGRRDTPDRPNITRVVVGRTAPRSAARVEGDVVVLESTVDDMDPRLWPSVLEALRQAGAWDCWTTGTVGRHGRPGRLVTALCAESVRSAVAEALLQHTTTLGVRWSVHQRLMLPRDSVTVPVGPAGGTEDVTLKTAERPDGTLSAQPELADVERAASALGWPVRRVVDAALAHWQREQQGELERSGRRTTEPRRHMSPVQEQSAGSEPPRGKAADRASQSSTA
ncbi:nickel pincer cofactor biosynthesis protein LarC [Streptomyces sp. NPDC000070]|uniref:nickel pincer cofactor biosynthesis protein LarC n=1 Tax=Streptomyces sp. NPDC000070 TaxID=3154240 RepID=UPI003334403E